MAKKYIDAELLRKEIESLKSLEYPCDNSEQNFGFEYALDRLSDSLDSLQQEQTSEDLTTEVKKYFQGLWPGMETAEQCNTDMHFTPPAIMRLANHFYELGKNSKIK